MKIIVFSAIFGGKDAIAHDQPGGADYCMFTDRPFSSPAWQGRYCPALPVAGDPSRSSRFFKLMPHRHFPGYDFSVWIDGDMALLEDPRILVDRYLVKPGHFHAQQAYDVARYAPKGAVHSNLYHEAALCIRNGKDNSEVIRRQVERYRSEGAWFDEVMRESRRDQIALPYVLWKTKNSIVTIPADCVLLRRGRHLR